jgi:hypothetical protein
MPTTIIQDFTIFKPTDDLVPLFGNADAQGNVTVASFSTDPTHPRPYLKLVENVGESTIDFLTGGSVIGQMQIELVDVRIDPADQDSGFVTYMLADDSADTQLLGCRGVFRQLNQLGVMEVVFDGVIGPILLNPDTLVTFSIQLRDARERERKLRCFDYANSTCIFPRIGPADGWGYPTRYSDVTGWEKFGDPVYPPVTGFSGTYHDFVGVGGYFTLIADKASIEQNVALNSKYGDTWKNYGEAVRIPASGTLIDLGGGVFVPTNILDTFCHPNIIVEWLGNDHVWHQCNSPKASLALLPSWSTTNAFAFGPVSEKDQRERLILVQFAYDPTDASLSHPANNATVQFRVKSNREPTETVPLYIEENFGTLLREIYDGNHSRGTVMPVRFEEAAMGAMERETPIARARITAPVDDGRAWTQEHVYKICGYAPASRNGLVVPIKYEIPSAEEPLLLLDNSNVISATWSHAPDNIVNEVVVEYERDLVPANITGGLVDVTTQRVVIQRDRINSQSRNGTKPLNYKPVTIRAVVPASAALVSTSDETGTVLGMKRAEEALRRFTFGAQTCEVECDLTPYVAAAKEGDWVLFSPTWLPDYQSRKRGMNRLMQIAKVSRMQPWKRGFSLIDAGPYDQPVGLPTIGGMTENSDLSLTLTVTSVPAGGKVEVQYAIGEVQPAPLSGEWKMAGEPLQAAGTISTPGGLQPSALVWMRARGTADGRRASAWVAAGSHRMTARALLRTFTLRVGDVTAGADYGKPWVQWEKLSLTAGVRIRWELFGPNDVVPTVLPNTLDVDASGLATVQAVYLPIVLRQWQQIVVEITAYPGFAAGAVTGTPGATTFRKSTQRRDDPYQAPMLSIIPSETGTVGTLQIDIADPQLQVTKVEFYTQQGSNAPSAWTVDGSIPYGASVTLVEGKPSFVGYRVTGYDGDGVERILGQDVVAFDEGAYPVLVDIDLTIDPATGHSIARWVGDSDTASVKILGDTSGFPSAAAVRATSAINGRTGSIDFGIISPGVMHYVSALAYSGAGGTGLESTQKYDYQEARPILTGTVAPGIQETATETAVGTVPMVGSLVISVTDPQLRVTGVRARTQIGNGAWSAYSSTLAPPRTYTVTMVVGHISKIEYEVYADLGAGSVLYFRSVVAFGTGSIPVAPSIETSFDSVGNLNITVTGDSDTMSIRLGASLSSAANALANMAAASPIAGRIVQYTNVLLAVASGATVFVACAAYPTVGGTGTASDTTQVTIARQGPGGQTPSGIIGKTLRVHASQFASNGADPWVYTTAGIGIQASGGTVFGKAAFAYVPLPFGITITGFTARVFDIGSPSSCNISLVRVTTMTGGTDVTVGQVNPSAAGAEQNASASFSEGPILGASYVLVFTTPTLSSGQAWFTGWVDIVYTMPSYDKTI